MIDWLLDVTLRVAVVWAALFIIGCSVIAVILGVGVLLHVIGVFTCGTLYCS